MRFFTLTQILKMHKDIIDRTSSNSKEYAIRDIGLLQSALSTIFHSFQSKFLYPTIQEKVARLCYGIIKNHPFIDGNKRMGLHLMLITLVINNVHLNYTDDEMVELIMDVVTNKTSLEELTYWIFERSY